MKVDIHVGLWEYVSRERVSMGVRERMVLLLLLLLVMMVVDTSSHTIILIYIDRGRVEALWAGCSRGVARASVGIDRVLLLLRVLLVVVVCIESGVLDVRVLLLLLMVMMLLLRMLSVLSVLSMLRVARGVGSRVVGAVWGIRVQRIVMVRMGSEVIGLRGSEQLIDNVNIAVSVHVWL